MMVVRPSKGRAGAKTEWLKGTVSSADIAEEAEALLSDPRDKILRVHVWSEKENQFVHTFRRPQAGAEAWRAA